METKEKRTHWRKVFLSDYLGSCDIEQGDLKLVIKCVTIKAVKGSDGKAQDRNVATFTDPKVKPMVLNVINSKQVKAFSGSRYIEDWNNIPITVYVKDDIKAFGEVTDGLRIRPVQPQMTKPELKPGGNPWKNAVGHLKKEGSTIDDIKKHYIVSAENEQKLKDEAI